MGTVYAFAYRTLKEVSQSLYVESSDEPPKTEDIN